jgi:hypothetical protein
MVAGLGFCLVVRISLANLVFYSQCGSCGNQFKPTQLKKIKKGLGIDIRWRRSMPMVDLCIWRLRDCYFLIFFSLLSVLVPVSSFRLSTCSSVLAATYLRFYFCFMETKECDACQHSSTFVPSNNWQK